MIDLKLFNTYSRKCIKSIEKNYYIKKLNISEASNIILLELFENIQNCNDKHNVKYKKNDAFSLEKLRNNEDNYILMDEYTSIINKLNKKNSGELISILEDNNKKAFADWIIINHRYYDTIKDYKKYDLFKMKDREHIHELLYNNPFVSLNIQSYYETHSVNVSIYKNDNIELYLYEYKNMPKINVKKIFNIVTFVRKINNSNKNVKIIFLSSPHKKKYKNINNIFLPIHVNSGSTLRNEYINIWRYEEWEKVLIHELIHYLDYDTDKHIKLKSNYNIDNILPNEAYTDFLAIILHTMYISTSYDQFKEYLLLEINFSLQQAAKILFYSNINKFDNNVSFKQKSAAFSYYIIKSSLFVNLDKSINILLSNIKLNKHINKFIDLVDESLNNSEFISSIKYYIDYVSKNNLNIGPTLRMSCLQTL